jgi:hypothetical protein
MRIIVASHWLIGLIVIFLVACRAEQALTTIPTSTVPVETSTERPVMLLTSTPVHTPQATITALPTAATKWSTYVFTEGVSVEYPAGWIVTPYTTLSLVDFSSTAEKYDPMMFTVRVELYLRPMADHEITDPHSWENNEGGYKVHWEKPISIESAEGLEFMWGVIQQGQWWTPPSLNAVYYSKLYELDVRLKTSFDRENIELITMADLPESMAARVTVFEHMVQSVRFNQ